MITKLEIFLIFIIFILFLIFIISKSLCNNKSCINGTCSFGKCKCNTKFEGDKCDIEILCKNKTCDNGGTCYNGICTCQQGFSGSNCSTIQPMSSNITPSINSYNIYFYNNNEKHKLTSNNDRSWGAGPDTDIDPTDSDNNKSLFFRRKISFICTDSIDNNPITYNTPYNICILLPGNFYSNFYTNYSTHTFEKYISMYANIENPNKTYGIAYVPSNVKELDKTPASWGYEPGIFYITNDLNYLETKQLVDISLNFYIYFKKTVKEIKTIYVLTYENITKKIIGEQYDNTKSYTKFSFY
jgi:hypothetical protein